MGNLVGMINLVDILFLVAVTAGESGQRYLVQGMVLVLMLGGGMVVACGFHMLRCCVGFDVISAEAVVRVADGDDA